MKKQSPIVKLSLIGLLVLGVFQSLTYLKVVNQYIVELPVEGRKTAIEEVTSVKELDSKKINSLLIQSKERIKESDSLAQEASLDSLFSIPEEKTVEEKEPEPEIDLHVYFKKLIQVQAIHKNESAIINNNLMFVGDKLTLPSKKGLVQYEIVAISDNKVDLKGLEKDGHSISAYLR